MIRWFADRHDSERLRGLVTDRQMDGQTFAIVESLSRLKTHNFVPPKEIYKPGVETVLVNGPPIGQHSYSSDLICQRRPPEPTFPPMMWPKRTLYSTKYTNLVLESTTLFPRRNRKKCCRSFSGDMCPNSIVYNNVWTPILASSGQNELGKKF